MSYSITGVKYVRVENGRCVMRVRFPVESGSRWMSVCDAVELGLLPHAWLEYKKQYSCLEATVLRCKLMEIAGLSVPDSVAVAAAEAQNMIDDQKAERSDSAEIKQKIDNLRSQLGELLGWCRENPKRLAVRCELFDLLECGIAEISNKPNYYRVGRPVAKRSKKLTDEELRRYKPGIFGVHKPTPVNSLARKVVSPRK